MEKLIIFGDSIMRGVLLDEGKYICPSEERHAREETTGIEIESCCKFGATIDKAQAIVQRRIAKGGLPARCLIEFGGNDSDFKWSEISMEPDKEHLPLTSMADFKQNIAAMTEELRAQGVQPIMMTLPPIEPNRYLDFVSRNGNSRENILKWLGYVEKIYETHKSYSDAVAEIAQERIVPLVDVRSAFPSGNALGEYMCIDGVHPDKKGYQLIADSFASFFEKALA